jgi:hypothetical protein
MKTALKPLLGISDTATLQLVDHGASSVDSGRRKSKQETPVAESKQAEIRTVCSNQD